MGGHAFLQAGQRGTYQEHIENARLVCRQLMTFVERGYNLVVTHGNGPQVGDLLTQVELARERVPPLPLEVLVAQTEGSLGYYLQLGLLNELRAREVKRYVVTVVTQVTVDREDPAFAHPSKPVGRFMSEDEARRAAEQLGWRVGEDAGRGWRRLVPSPKPLKVIQRGMVGEAARAGHIVIAGGGGGIPVAKGESEDYEGVEAVIDKDLTASVLATDVGADLLVILTAVDAVSLHFGKPQEVRLGAVTLSECARYIAEGHFAAGSMGPKVEALYQFLLRGGRRGLITSPGKLAEALDGTAGTHFVGRL
jgi:carbamate kinase